MIGLLNQLDEDRYHDWVASIITQKSSKHTPDAVQAAQQTLVDAAAAGPNRLAGYMADSLGARLGDLVSETPPLPQQLSDAEMTEPVMPDHAAERVAAALGDVSRAEAAKPLFWVACHTAWIKEGFFGDLLTVFLSSRRSKGLPTLEAQARNFIRRTGGIETVRGKISTLTDCPISRVWWRAAIARESADASGGLLTVERAQTILRDPVVSVALAQRSVKTLTALSAPRARAAFLLAVEDTELLVSGHKEAEVVSSLRALGRTSHSFCLAATPLSELRKVARAGIKECRERDAAAASQTEFQR